MFMAAPLDFFIRFSYVYFLPAECAAAHPTPNPAAKCITVLIYLCVLDTLLFLSICTELTNCFRFFSADNGFMVIADQILGKFSMVPFFCYPAFYLVLNHTAFNQIKKRHSINYSDGFYIGLLYAVPLVLS